MLCVSFDLNLVTLHHLLLHRFHFLVHILLHRHLDLALHHQRKLVFLHRFRVLLLDLRRQVQADLVRLRQCLKKNFDLEDTFQVRGVTDIVRLHNRLHLYICHLCGYLQVVFKDFNFVFEWNLVLILLFQILDLLADLLEML